MKHADRVWESIELGVVLSLAGGFMDAYSYLCRDHVFANAQTGNMLLLGIRLSERSFPAAFRPRAFGGYMEMESLQRCALAIYAAPRKIYVSTGIQGKEKED